MSGHATFPLQRNPRLTSLRSIPCSFVVGASEVSGLRANLISAAFQASEIALRSVKPGVRNWEVTEAVKHLLKEYEASGIKGIEGILSHQVSILRQVCALRGPTAPWRSVLISAPGTTDHAKQPRGEEGPDCVPDCRAAE